ncbi:MAG TPA: hypothetical protein VGU90_02460 [Terriglobales bacterium]|nr:hypothetical protein [Terriglobales bacterium]
MRRRDFFTLLGGAPLGSQEGAHDNIDHLVDPIVARYIAGVEEQPRL